MAKKKLAKKKLAKPSAAGKKQPKRKYAKLLSLWPLTLEQALAGAMAVPFPDVKQPARKPKAKPKAKRKANRASG